MPKRRWHEFCSPLWLVALLSAEFINFELWLSGILDDEQAYSELFASATLSLVNDIYGDKYYLPFSIGVYVGPCYSVIETSSTSIEDDFGYVAGLEVFYTKRISFFATANQFGSNSSSATVGVHLCL